MMNDFTGRARPAFLASVTGLEEARAALTGGADLIDCKMPSAGALGALPADEVARVVGEVAGRAPVSATIGDLWEDIGEVAEAVSAMAATGVDFVKVGFFGTGKDLEIARAVAATPVHRARAVAVLMADRGPDVKFVAKLADLGFAAVMLDTADKGAGPLTEVLPRADIERFVREVRASGVASGLAGSLRCCDVASLRPIQPNILGFRGALCEGGRTGRIDITCVSAIRAELDAPSPADARPVA